MHGRQLFSGLKEDADEDAYFNGDDDDDEMLGDDDELQLPTAASSRLPNGHTVGSSKPLVDYPDDDDEDDDDFMDLTASSSDIKKENKSSSSNATSSEDAPRGRDRSPKNITSQHHSPPEPVAVKRRREDEDDDDELGKMMGGGVKRRNSSASMGSNSTLGASKLTLDKLEGSSEDAFDSSPKSVKQEEPQSPSPGHGHVLRRKGSLKVKNEGPVNPGRYAIKPINNSGGKVEAGEGEQRNGNGNGNGSVGG